jgi:hypothetical protein
VLLNSGASLTRKGKLGQGAPDPRAPQGPRAPGQDDVMWDQTSSYLYNIYIYVSGMGIVGITLQYKRNNSGIIYEHHSKNN